MYAGIRSAQVAGGDAVAKLREKDGKHKTMNRSQKGRFSDPYDDFDIHINS